MNCPCCTGEMIDVTETWHTFAEARGAEYLATYVTIWHCPNCKAVAGAADGQIEWVMEPEGVLAEE